MLAGTLHLCNVSAITFLALLVICFSFLGFLMSSSELSSRVLVGFPKLVMVVALVSRSPVNFSFCVFSDADKEEAAHDCSAV